MTDGPSSPRVNPEHEDDVRPADPAIAGAHLDLENIRQDAANYAYLHELAEALNTTLDLETLLKRTAELVAAIIPYRIFAILLVNDRTREMRVRFQIGHTMKVEQLHIPMGK